MSNQPKLVPLENPAEIKNKSDLESETVSIAKPTGFDLNKFASKRGAAMAGVGTLQTALPVHRINDAKDFVRLHPNDDPEAGYWSVELCFVNVPIKGQKRETLHLIDEDLAMEFLSSAKVLRYRLALASKPWDVFFFCLIPTTNLDNSWNSTNLTACLQAKERWVMATSRKDEGVEGYKVDFTRHDDAFVEPKWPSASLSELIVTTFAGRMVEHEQHPGLLRLIGARQDVS